MKKISRRKFITASAQGAAGLSITAGCNNREIIGKDKRPPSAPKGLEAIVEFDESDNKKTVLTWNEHDLTDLTGSFSEIGISGYNVYRDRTQINTSIVTQNNFDDTNDLVLFEEYIYQIKAIDLNGNKSKFSNPVSVKVKQPSNVYVVTDSKASSNMKINQNTITQMCHAGVKTLTGFENTVLAYESLFPKLTDKTIIAIKINCLAGSKLSTHPEVVEAIIDGLKQMQGGTFPIYNIIVFDDRSKNHMNNAGFILKNTPGDYRVVTTKDSWSHTEHIISGTKQHFSTIVEQADYIINVPVLKDHINAGVTFALKNFFGIIDKPGNMHGNMCDPYISEVYKIVASKVSVIIGDAVFGAHNGGPDASPTFNPNSLIIGTDPVATDKHALSLINQVRLKFKSLYEISTKFDPDNPKRKDARHLITSDNIGLGTINKKIIEISL